MYQLIFRLKKLTKLFTVNKCVSTQFQCFHLFWSFWNFCSSIRCWTTMEALPMLLAKIQKKIVSINLLVCLLFAAKLKLSHGVPSFLVLISALQFKFWAICNKIYFVNSFIYLNLNNIHCGTSQPRYIYLMIGFLESFFLQLCSFKGLSYLGALV